MVSSSSGLGRLVLIQKIAGSTPAEITTHFINAHKKADSDFASLSATLAEITTILDLNL